VVELRPALRQVDGVIDGRGDSSLHFIRGIQAAAWQIFDNLYVFAYGRNRNETEHIYQTQGPFTIMMGRTRGVARLGHKR
jgi:hypothetical protein